MDVMNSPLGREMAAQAQAEAEAKAEKEREQCRQHTRDCEAVLENASNAMVSAQATCKAAREKFASSQRVADQDGREFGRTETELHNARVAVDQASSDLTAARSVFTG